MWTLRQMILALMLVVVVPWHAYGMAYAARPSGVVMPEAVAAVSLPGPHITTPAQTPTYALAARKCRTAMLPGLSCIPDPAIHPAPPTSIPPPRNVRFLRSGGWTAADEAMEPPTGPPRYV
jgi:hypothetical protein